jgi:hypothetical protein
VQQGRFGGCLRVVLLLVLAVARAVGPDDPSVFVAPHLDLALAACESAGGELLDESFIVTAQALEDRFKGVERGAGDHALRVLAWLRASATGRCTDALMAWLIAEATSSATWVGW